MGRFDILLVGHRGTGKSTTAAAMRALGADVVDLDDVIAAATGSTAAELVARDEPNFRSIESRTLRALTDDAHPTSRFIVCGAGCLDLPSNALVVWMSRPGWEASALAERARLRPELSFEAEVAWMRAHREPIWREHANLLIEIPRGRTPRRVARELIDLIRWAQQGGTVARRSWLVNPLNAENARFLVNALGLRGAELRSDAETPTLTCRKLVSLRTPEPHWLRQHEDADVVDIDEKFLRETLDSGILSHLQSRRLVVSCHPEVVDADIVARLNKARILAENALPDWTVTTKAAGLLAVNVGADTLLPIDAHRNWLRVLRAFENEHNYIAPGLKPARFQEPDGIPPMDLQDWLPYFGIEHAHSRAALVGLPVEHSQGVWWHRAASVDDPDPMVYLKVPCARGNLQQTLAELHDHAVRAVSVTTPLKSEAAQAVGTNLPAVNTLKHVGHWVGTDTDADGMTAALHQVAEHGINQGRALVIGAGAVSTAILRSLAESPFEVIHMPARTTTRFPDADLVINASGRRVEPPPKCKIWLDLHYTKVEAADASVHLNGDAFFEGQARAQRQFWNLEPT